MSLTYNHLIASFHPRDQHSNPQGHQSGSSPYAALIRSTQDLTRSILVVYP